MSFKIVLSGIWHNPGNHGRRIARTLRAVGWQLDKRLFKRRRLITLPNGVRMTAYPDCVVSSSLIYSDWPEYHELHFVRSQLRPGEYVLDVGANIGHVSLLLADLVGAEKLIAFEPTPVSFRRLQENWKLNGWNTGRLHKMAIGAEAGALFIPDSERPETTNSLKKSKGSRDVEVLVKPLDALAGLWSDAPVGLLKIDVEGFEAAVFRGAAQMLRSRRPGLIMFESLEGRLSPEIVKVFTETNYRPFQLDSDGIPDLSRLTAQNLFAVPTERVIELKTKP